MKRLPLVIAIFCTLASILIVGYAYYKKNINSYIQNAAQLISQPPAEITPTPALVSTSTEVPAIFKEVPMAVEIPEVITTAAGEVFTLNKYIDPVVYGDYTSAGYDCKTNPFYNDRTAKGFRVSPKVVDATTSTIYQFVFDSNYENFLLIDQNSKCHPFKLSFSFLNTVINEKDNTKYLSFNPSIAPELALTDKNSYLYSEKVFRCETGPINLIEPKKILEKNEDFGELLSEVSTNLTNFRAWIFPSETIYNYEDYKNFEFIKYVGLAGANYAYLEVKPYGGNQIFEQESFFKSMNSNRGLVFISTPVLGDNLFGLVNKDFTFKPTCRF
jgi:hypothetical protein